jgi:hypothetical protein
VALTARFKEKIVDLGALHASLVPHLAELPHLAPDHAALEPLLAEARSLESRQDQAKAQLREVNQRRIVLERESRALRNRLAAGLRNAFGPDSHRLREFRIQPLTRRPRSRRSTLERAEQLAREAARVKALAEAEAAAKAAAEAKLRAAVAGPATE